MRSSMKISGIKLLTNSDGQDLVAEVLRSVNLRTVVFGRAVLSHNGLESQESAV